MKEEAHMQLTKEEGDKLILAGTCKKPHDTGLIVSLQVMGIFLESASQGIRPW